MQPVGKLYQHNANILRHCKKHFAEVFDVCFFLGNTFDFIELCHALNKHCNLLAELVFYLLVAERSVLNNIVQQACDNRFRVKLNVGKYARNLKRMLIVRFAGMTVLHGMLLFAAHICLVQSCFVTVCIFVVFPYF